MALQDATSDGLFTIQNESTLMISSSIDGTCASPVPWACQYSAILLEPLQCPVKPTCQLPALCISFSDDFPLPGPGQTLLPFPGVSKEDIPPASCMGVQNLPRGVPASALAVRLV